MQSCRECQFFNIEAAKNRAGAVLSSKSVKCGWTLTVPVPDSVPEYNRKIQTHFVGANDGAACKAFIRRTTEKGGA